MKKFILTSFLLIVFIRAGLVAQIINAPSDLEAEPEENTYIKVRWDDNSSNEQGFNIERSLVNDTASINWETIWSAPQNSRQFFDYWVTNQVTYYYRVYAFSDNERSPCSNIAYTMAEIDTANIPSAPSNLRVTNTTPVSISIRWDDNSDNETGFIIARKREGELLFRYIDTVLADVLTYQEVGLTPDNVYYYKVCAYNSFGLSDYTNTVSARAEKNTSVINFNSEIPDNYFLGNNYPNPFNPATNIKFGIQSSSFVRLIIYNSLGIEVEKLVNENLAAGIYQVKWNAQYFSSGMYFYKLESGIISETKKMFLIK